MSALSSLVLSVPSTGSLASLKAAVPPKYAAPFESSASARDGETNETRRATAINRFIRDPFKCGCPEAESIWKRRGRNLGLAGCQLNCQLFDPRSGTIQGHCGLFGPYNKK